VRGAAFLRLRGEERRRAVENALKRVLEKQRGTACTVRPSTVARELGLPLSKPTLLTALKRCMQSLREVEVNGSRWRLVSVSKTHKNHVRFYYVKVCSGWESGREADEVPEA